MEKQRLAETFGMSISDIDLSTPIDEEAARDLRETFDREGLLVFRRQSFTKQSLAAGSTIFGELDIHPIENVRDDDVPEIITLATHGKNDDIKWNDGEEMVGVSTWHVDMGYSVRPCRAAMLYGVQHPEEGGRTGFIDCAAAYDALDPDTRTQIDRLHVVQSWRYGLSREAATSNANFKDKDGGEDLLILDQFPDLVFPMVNTHPATGRRILNCVPMYATDIVEMPGAEGRALIDRLIDHLVQPRFIYWHDWQPGDAVMWDNWRTNHAAEGCKAKYARKMWRTTILGTVDFGRRLRADESASTRTWERGEVPLYLPV